MSNYFMEASMLFKVLSHHPKSIGVPSAGVIMAFLVIISLLYMGCQKDPIPSAPVVDSPYVFETTGEEFLISALDEIQTITEFVAQSSNIPLSVAGLDSIRSILPSKDHKIIISAVETDTTYMYGEVTPDGYGAVVTERHTYPKGILLITVRKTHGKPPEKVVTQTLRYITYEDFLNDTTQQSNITEVYGLSSDTIVTHVNRNGVIETYTFRLPVITSITDPDDGTVRITSRYGFGGAVYSEIKDGFNNLVQLRISRGEADGGVITRYQYPDSSWRNVRIIGRADGSVYHEITSGP
jgi:hypothetical protein